MGSFLSWCAWSFGVAIGAVISPGPVSAAVVAEGVRRGIRVGPLISTGHALAELVMVGVLALGGSQAAKYPVLAVAISLVGGAVLLWMGGTLIWRTARDRPTLPRSGDPSRLAAGRSLVGLGLVTTVVNPFWYIWWVGTGGAYVMMTQQQGAFSLLAFYVGHISADYAWNTFLASAAGSGRRWLSDGVYRGLLIVCGVFLLYTGLRFIWAGLMGGIG